MQPVTSNDIYHITLSKWKVWAFTIFFWTLACLPLLLIVALTKPLFIDGKSVNIFGLAFVSLLFLIFAGPPFLLMAKLKRPLTTFSRDGFSAWKKSKTQHYPWTPNTVITGGQTAYSVLANLDMNQGRLSKLFKGPKSSVLIRHLYAEQKPQDILDAINRLCPYPVKDMSMWRVAMF